MRTARRRGERPQVVVLFVGRREPRSRASDAWTILHDLFNVENPPENHSKPPCCQQDIPEIPDEQLTEFLRAVRRLTRHRR
jgi:hypothetical protein